MIISFYAFVFYSSASESAPTVRVTLRPLPAPFCWIPHSLPLAEITTLLPLSFSHTSISPPLCLAFVMTQFNLPPNTPNTSVQQSETQPTHTQQCLHNILVVTNRNDHSCLLQHAHICIAIMQSMRAHMQIGWNKAPSFPLPLLFLPPPLCMHTCLPAYIQQC